MDSKRRQELIEKINENTKYNESADIVKKIRDSAKSTDLTDNDSSSAEFRHYMKGRCYICNDPFNNEGGWIIRHKNFEYYVHDDC